MSPNTFHQQIAPMSSDTCQWQSTPSLPYTFNQQTTAPTSFGAFQWQSTPTSPQQQTATTSLQTFRQQTAQGTLPLQQMSTPSFDSQSAKQDSAMYCGNTSAPQSDLETLLSDLDADVDDEYLSSSSSAINRCKENQINQPDFSSNLHFNEQSSSSRDAAYSEEPVCYPPPPFPSPSKLLPVSDVIKEHPGSDVATLRELTIALAKDSIFGRDELSRSSLSGRKNTATLDQKKLNYIKRVVYSRCPKKPIAEFEYIWTMCRSSLSKCCQGLRSNAKKIAEYKEIIINDI